MDHKTEPTIGSRISRLQAFQRGFIPCLVLGFTIAAAPASGQVTVSITAPANNAILPAPGPITLSAAATPSGGATITNVQFYQGNNLLGQTAVSPYSITWSSMALGNYSLQAVAYDSSGANAYSVLVPVSVLSGLPYTTDFEFSGGYALGPINGQLGWSVTQGDVEVVGTGAYSGAQCVSLNPSTPVAQLANQFAPTTGQNPVYIDFFAKPAADPSVASSTIINAGGAQIGFLLGGAGAVVQVFNGNGSGGGSWITPTPDPALALSVGSNQTAFWHRFTFREDYSAQTWDLYVDGQMIAYNLGFQNPASPYFSSFGISGHATAPTGLDQFSADLVNPLFANISDDGISDSWKIQYGLDPSQNLRNASPNGNGIPLIQYYISGTNPLDYFNGRAVVVSSPPNANGVAYTYDASGRLTSASFGNLSSQSFTLDNAANPTSVTTTSQPVVAWRMSNGIPANGAGTGADSASPAGDNLPNLAKYALGLPALVPAPGSYPSVVLVQVNGSSYLAVDYERPDPAPGDLTYTVQVSADGLSWLSGGGNTTTVSTVVTNGIADVVVRDNTPISTPQFGRYIRLQIVRSIIP